MRNSVRLSFSLSLALVASLSLSLAGSDSWSREPVMSESFDVRSGDRLRVELPDADIALRVGSSDRLTIDVELGAHDMKWALEHLDAMDLRADATGGEVVLEADEVRMKHRDWSRSFQLNVLIELPRRFDVDLRTDDGDVSVEGLDGELLVRTSDGDIRIGDVEGSQARIRTSDGDVRVGEVIAATVEVHTSDGDVDIRRLEGDRFDIHTSDGEIRIDDVSGVLKATTSDGDIRIGFDRVAETTLKTGDGDILLLADGSLNADVDLRGEEIVIRGIYGFEGERDDDFAKGSLNGGGPLLRASSRDGSVVIRTR